MILENTEELLFHSLGRQVIKMEVLNSLEKLEDLLENSWNIFGVSLVNKNEILDLLNDIRVKMPDEIKQAKWIKEERQRILLEAQKEASEVIKEAETRIVSMIDENEITRQAYNQANETIINAQRTAREIKQASLEYADDIIAKIEENLKDTYMVLHKNREELKVNKNV